jgi:hypothetical protein
LQIKHELITAETNLETTKNDFSSEVTMRSSNTSVPSKLIIQILLKNSIGLSQDPNQSKRTPPSHLPVIKIKMFTRGQMFSFFYFPLDPDSESPIFT